MSNLEGPRILDTGTVEAHWNMPWACVSCHRYGRIEVQIPPPDGAPAGARPGSTNDQIKDMIERAHFGSSSGLCVAPMSQRVVGRIYRFVRGEKIYLRAKNEKPEDVKDQRWPPWERTAR